MKIIKLLILILLLSSITLIVIGNYKTILRKETKYIKKKREKSDPNDAEDYMYNLNYMHDNLFNNDNIWDKYPLEKAIKDSNEYRVTLRKDVDKNYERLFLYTKQGVNYTNSNNSTDNQNKLDKLKKEREYGKRTKVIKNPKIFYELTNADMVPNFILNKNNETYKYWREQLKLAKSGVKFWFNKKTNKLISNTPPKFLIIKKLNWQKHLTGYYPNQQGRWYNVLQGFTPVQPNKRFII